MTVTAGAAAKAALAALSSGKARKAAGWIAAAILSPLIVLTAFVCALAGGTANHNDLAVKASFYGTEFSDDVPSEFREHIEDMQTSFSVLDRAVTAVNSAAEGGGVDLGQVKSVFYALCFGDDVPSRRAADRFVDCFYTTETRASTVTVVQEDGTVVTHSVSYTVNVPVSMSAAYANLAAAFDREITPEDKNNADHIYAMIYGAALGGGSFSGNYIAGGERSVELDLSSFCDPDTKNSRDLVAYVVNAWQSGWGYVWGTFGDVLTPALLDYKEEQYPDGVGSYKGFIEEHWLGARTTDCVGLVKGYGWLNPESLELEYDTNGMPDVGANQMYYASEDSGPIDSLPEVPGVAVWMDGHMGVYIGDGEVIEAMGTHYGVVKTQLDERGWTNWFRIPYINYD